MTNLTFDAQLVIWLRMGRLSQGGSMAKAESFTDGYGKNCDGRGDSACPVEWSLAEESDRKLSAARPSKYQAPVKSFAQRPVAGERHSGLCVEHPPLASSDLQVEGRRTTQLQFIACGSHPSALLAEVSLTERSQIDA